MDPNDIVGQPREYEVWLAPDWSDYNEKQKKASNWTRVSVRETLYADGRRITQVLDANRAPITNQVLAQDTDPAQEKRFKDAQTTASREQAQAERKRVSVTYEGTGANRKRRTVYESGADLVEDAPETGAVVPADAVPRIEGTPLPGGGFDNEQPVQVWRRPDGTVVKTEPLTGPERTKWDQDRERSRNPGGKTDAQLAAEKPQETRTPVPDRPGYTQVTAKNPQTGVTETYYLGPDGKRTNTLPEKPQVPKPETAPDGTHGYWDIKPGQQPRWVPLPGGPGAKPTPPVVVNGVYGVWKPHPTDPKGAPTWEPLENQPGRAALPTDAPQFDNSSAEAAFRSYQELFAYVDRKVRSGEWTAEQGKGILAGPHEMTGQLLDRAKEERQAAESLRRDQLTERSQDMTQTGNRLQFSQGASGTAIKHSADLIKAAEGGESTIVPLMVLQAGMGQAMGGFREAPSVTRGSGLLPAVAQRAGAGFAQAAPASPETVGQPGKAMTAPPEIPTTPERVQGIMQNPVFRPSPEVVLPGAAPPLGQGQDLSTPPPVNPPAGQSGHNPSAPVGLMPSQILKSGTGQGTRTADDLERELLAEGFSLEEVRAARMRAQQRAGIVAVA